VPVVTKPLGAVHAAVLANLFIPLEKPREQLVLRIQRTLADYLPDASEFRDGGDSAAVYALRVELAKISVHEGELHSRRVAVVKALSFPAFHVLDDAAQRPSVADALGEAMIRISPDDWAVSSALATVFRHWLQRREVGATLLAETPLDGR
jgi:hypothetical protein